MALVEWKEERTVQHNQVLSRELITDIVHGLISQENVKAQIVGQEMSCFEEVTTEILVGLPKGIELSIKVTQ